MFRQKYILCLCGMVMACPAWAKIDVSIQPNPVAYGTSVELVISSDTPLSGVPNLSLLEKDFIIGGQQQRQSSSWVNGVGKTLYELSYTLFPNKLGKIVIPTLTIGTEKTSELTLTVQDKSAVGGKSISTGQGLELNVSCDTEQVYPEQSLTCKAQLIDPLGVRSGQFIAPQGDDFIWQESGQPRTMVGTYNGKRVHIFEQSFIFKSTISGEIKIPAFLFQGEALLDTTPVGSQRINSWMDLMFVGMGTATQPVSALSKPFVISVLKKPKDWQGWWLPSSDVTMTETYQMPQSIHVGESIERTVVLTAKDVSADALPIPQLNANNMIKVYPGVEKRESTAIGSKLTITYTLVPIHSGEITLPSITVPWFDVVNRTVRNAVVPERVVFVSKGADIMSNNESKAVLPQIKQQITKDIPDIQPSDQNKLTPKEVPNWLVWTLVACSVVVAFILGIVGTLYFVHRQTKDEGSPKRKKKPLPDLYPF